MDIFGNTDPKLMPRHLFGGAYQLDYSTAIRGNPEQQNFSICPRHWYLDAIFKCEMCGDNFTWTAAEQRTWFEDWHFWIDSVPNQCPRAERYGAMRKQSGKSTTLSSRKLATEATWH